MPKLQNFSTPAGDACEINFDVDPNDGVTLLGSTPYWFVYPQSHGIPDRSGGPVIKKMLDHGLQITDTVLLTFQVILVRGATLDLLGNYYHEAIVVDEAGRHVTVTQGIMDVTDVVASDFTVEEIPAP